MFTKIQYWLDTHTKNPLVWWYVILKSIYYSLQDAFRPKSMLEGSINLEGTCPHTDLTEQGLCEKCGNRVL